MVSPWYGRSPVAAWRGRTRGSKEDTELTPSTVADAERLTLDQSHFVLEYA